MTSRGLALIWCAVLALGTVAAVALTALGEDHSAIFGDIPAPTVIVIGSSLMLHAVPPSGDGADSLLGDGRAHARLVMSNITEAQTVALLGLVLKTGVQTVLIEANALAFDFPSRAPVPDQGGFRPVVVMQSLLDLSARAKASLSTLLNPGRLATEAQNLDATFMVQSDVLAKNYPLHLRFPRNPEALEEVLKTAVATGVDLILIAPPRSQLAANAMGPQATETLRLHFQALARRLDLPLFQPAAVWPNDHFIDLAHMNRRGRARFMLELAQWWASRP
jgi:hypothetical protein